jgi:hypothetical protein
MDVTMLANDLTVLLARLLPYLLKVGQKAAEEAGKKFGGDAWDWAKELWAKLRPEVNTTTQFPSNVSTSSRAYDLVQHSLMSCAVSETGGCVKIPGSAMRLREY